MPLVYPELKAKFGDVVTYEQAPRQHTQLEFAFDVVQLASGKYHTQDYHQKIGFQGEQVAAGAGLSENLRPGAGPGDCERGPEHCQLPLCREPADSDGGPGRLALQAQGHPEAEPRRPAARLPAAQPAPRNSAKNTARSTRSPGFGARIISYFIRVLPKIGPLKPFAFKLPTPEAQKLFRASFRNVMASYCAHLPASPPTRPPAP